MKDIAEELLSSEETTTEKTGAETTASETVKAVETTASTKEVKAEETTSSETVKPEKAETTVESPSTKEPAMIQASVMHGERDRRQAIQEEFDAYKTAHPEKDPEPPPSVFDEGGEEAAFAARDERLSQGLMDTLLYEGKSEATRQHGQELVDTAEAWFVAEVKSSPMLAKQLEGVSYMQQHRMVVDIYQKEMSRQDANQNPADHDARMKAEGVKEYLATLEAKQKGEKAVIDSIPKSLVGEASEGTIKSSDWKGPTDLESLIG